MPILVAHKIELKPNNRQKSFFVRCAGVSRFAYNWALREWKRQHAENEKVSEISLRKHLNAIKREQYPWMLDVPKSVVQQSIKNLGSAFSHFFRKVKAGVRGKKVGYPKLKRRKVGRDSFRIDNGDVKVNFQNQQLFVPKLGWVRLREVPRFEGRITQAIISRQADKWFVSLLIHSDIEPAASESQAVVGIDLGVNILAQLSTGESFYAPKPLKAYLKKLGKLNRRLHKSERGSNRRFKRRMQVAKLHAKIQNIRLDFLHKLTSYLASKFAIISIEDLNVSGMLANRRTAKAISDLGFFEFRRQLEYKLARAGGKLVTVDRWFPSSKTCSKCGSYDAEFARNENVYLCKDCGIALNRDLNASFNLLRKAFQEFNITEVPQALREVTLVDTLALLEEIFLPATSVVEARSNLQLCS